MSPSPIPAPATAPALSAPASARERLLDAAAEVFAREGLRAATTREIAHAAGVNEVTLFRLFKSKQNLLASVLERVFAEPPAAPSKGAKAATAARGLAEVIQEYVANYFARVSKNLTLLRVLMGEIQHFQEHELKVVRGIFLPERQKIIHRLRVEQERGLVRKEVDPAIVADQLSALVFMGTLRGALPLPREYSGKSYLEACVTTILQAIQVIEIPAPRPATPAKRKKP